MKFSSTTLCFYPDDIDYPVLPDDIVVVPDDDYTLAMNRAAGETLTLVDGRIVIAPRPAPALDELRQAKIAEIAAACEAELIGGFITASGIKMDSTLAALQKIKIGYDFALMIGETVMTVVDFDNVGHADLPMAEVQALMLETGGHYRDLYIKKQTLRGQALAAANASELDLIIW